MSFGYYIGQTNSPDYFKKKRYQCFKIAMEMPRKAISKNN